MVSKIKYYQMISAVAVAAASYLLVPMILKKNSDRLYRDRAGNDPADFADPGPVAVKPDEHRMPEDYR